MSYGFNPNLDPNKVMIPQENLFNQGLVKVASTLAFAVNCVATVYFNKEYEAIGKALGFESDAHIGGFLVLTACSVVGISGLFFKMFTKPLN